MKKRFADFCCRLVLISLAFMTFLVLLIAFYPPCRDWPAQLLVSNDENEAALPADGIILLMGDVADRTPQAAALWKKGVAPKIIFAEAEKDTLIQSGIRTSEGEATWLYLKQLGVPEDAIIFERQSANSSTSQEAMTLFKRLKLELPQARHFILCTSWYHSSRAAWILSKVNLSRYQLSSLPSAAPPHWYTKERDFLAVFSEYLKWIYYLTHY